MSGRERIVCAHQLCLTEDGQVTDRGPVVGCVILLVGLQTVVRDIRFEARVLGCESDVRSSCPFANGGLWLHCPGYQPPAGDPD